MIRKSKSRLSQEIINHDKKSNKKESNKENMLKDERLYLNDRDSFANKKFVIDSDEFLKTGWKKSKRVVDSRIKKQKGLVNQKNEPGANVYRKPRKKLKTRRKVYEASTKAQKSIKDTADDRNKEAELKRIRKREKDLSILISTQCHYTPLEFKQFKIEVEDLKYELTNRIMQGHNENYLQAENTKKGTYSSYFHNKNDSFTKVSNQSILSSKDLHKNSLLEQEAEKFLFRIHNNLAIRKSILNLKKGKKVDISLKKSNKESVVTKNFKRILGILPTSKSTSLKGQKKKKKPRFRLNMKQFLFVNGEKIYFKDKTVTNILEENLAQRRIYLDDETPVE